MVSQLSGWQLFYEQAWETRASFMRELIANGERDPARIVNLALGKERLLELKMYDGEPRWIGRRFAGELLPTGVPLFKKSSFLGNMVDIPFYSDYSFINLISDYFMKMGPFDAVMELGCGYGQNLFLLYSTGGPNVPYFGGEFTNSGVQMAKELAALAPERDYQFFHFNHLSPDLAEFPKGLRKVLVFTAHSIEQVTEIHESWFDVVAQAADEVHCIHLEPFGFQMRRTGPITDRHEQAIAKLGWNTNMVSVVNSASDRGVIQIDGMYPEVTFPSDPSNPGSLLIWRNKTA